VAEIRPTVIILDVLLPQEDGWELLMSLRADDRTRDIPVIVCSVLREPQLARSLGASAHLPKPVTQGALLEALTPWLRLHSNQMQAY
jgi:CheY-like chemotaxis protein